MQAEYRFRNPFQTNQIQIVPNFDLDIKYSNNAKGNLKYKKVSNNKKLQLIRRVLQQHYSIIQSSNLLGINYSTAKSIILIHKRNLKRCTQIQTNSSGNVKLSSSQCQNMFEKNMN